MSLGEVLVDISIHSPRARGDGATAGGRAQLANFNPLPSCEGRRLQTLIFDNRRVISIHSPRARGDTV